MKTADYILIGTAIVAAYVLLDSTKVKRRWYLPVRTDARWNLAIANSRGLLTGGQFAIYESSLTNGTVDPAELNAGLIEIAGGAR